MEGFARTVKFAGIPIVHLEGKGMKSLYSQINIDLERKEMVCLVGAGGKTSTMFRLARELSFERRKVLVTTTTAIYYPERKQYAQILISEKESLDLFDNRSNSGITVFGRSVSYEGKLLGVSPAFLDAVLYAKVFDYILVEGDGSRGRSVKAPAEHEPVIPSCSTKVLGLIGLDSIGKEVCPENVHRTDIFCSITGCCKGDIIDTDMISKLVVHKEGIFKAVPSLAERYLVLNNPKHYFH
jgi:probable selenium-dependent hydroxylase accessory protein YqeC